jgi:Arc/MetJ-type ribon-helix-helix transcriptional regulator
MQMWTYTIELSDDELAFAEEEAAAGGYASASEYVASLVEAARKREEELEAIRPDFCVGGAQGPDARTD